MPSANWPMIAHPIELSGEPTAAKDRTGLVLHPGAQVRGFLLATGIGRIDSCNPLDRGDRRRAGRGENRLSRHLVAAEIPCGRLVAGRRDRRALPALCRRSHRPVRPERSVVLRARPGGRRHAAPPCPALARGAAGSRRGDRRGGRRRLRVARRRGEDRYRPARRRSSAAGTLCIVGRSFDDGVAAAGDRRDRFGPPPRRQGPRSPPRASSG